MKRSLAASLLVSCMFASATANASAFDTAKEIMRDVKQYQPMFKQLNQGDFKKLTSNMKQCKANTDWYEDEFYYVKKADKCTEANAEKLKTEVAKTKEVISMQNDYGRFYSEFETKFAFVLPRMQLMQQEAELEYQIGEPTITKKQMLDVIDTLQETITAMSASNAQREADLKNIIHLMYSLNHRR